VKDITAVESVQRRFTKRLPGFNTCYRDRLGCLQSDLLWCCKIVFGVVDLNFDEFFEWSPRRGTRGHKYKVCKKFTGTRIGSEFFSERVITVWNELSVSLILAQLLVLKVVFYTPITLIISYVFNYSLFCCTSFLYFVYVFYCARGSCPVIRICVHVIACTSFMTK